MFKIMKYIIVEGDGGSITNCRYIGVYDNLMLLSKHLRDQFGQLGPNFIINTKHKIYDDLVKCGNFSTQLYITLVKNVIVVNSEHSDINKLDYVFLKEYLRESKINQLLLD